ncbi:MAG: histidine kinase dimerization/phospho-acceptor domain-containing protein [Steroidobacteraceae bacterium]
MHNDVASTHPGAASPGERQPGGPEAESERRYRAIFENPFDLIAVLDAVRDPEGAIVDWRYRDANANWIRALGRPREQLLGGTVSAILPARAAELIRLYTRVLSQSRPQQYEERSGDADLLISLFPIGRDSIVTSGVDISARIRAEAEVRRLLEVNRAEREWLLAVLNSMTEEVYFADAQQRYTYANPAALREFGHDKVQGVGIEQIVSRLEVLRTDGTPRPFCEAPPVRALAGEIVRDVTDKRMREKDRQATDQQRQRLIATLAHELRNPLAPIRTGIELLQKAREQPSLLDTVPPMMERQMRQLVALIDRMLEILRDAPPG